MECIKYIDRKSGQQKTENVPGEGMLKWLYSSGVGKITLQLLIKRKIVSAWGGWLMNRRWSAKRIRAFVDEHQINLTELACENQNAYKTFNAFFCRKLKPGVRPLGKYVVSPADGKILVFRCLKEVPRFFVKDKAFKLESFVRNEQLAKKYADGAMAIVRLAPADYHRYHFPLPGVASASHKINGYYFSVSPLALRQSLQSFCENKREYCTLSTETYGDVLMVDVGATMVGSIIQTYRPGSKVNKGDEKGYFAFGGSTLVLLFEAGKVEFDHDLLENTRKGLETSIRMGETIAR